MLIFIRHELQRWVRTPMLWIFLLVVSLLVMGAVSSDQVTIGGGVGSVHKNAPSVVQRYYGVMSLVCLLMTTAFMNATATRDFSTGMHHFIFSSPIRRRNYFFGKFFGAYLIAILPLLGVSIGALIGPLMPWATAERFGSVVWDGHLQGILAFAIPNTFIVAVLVYALATNFRSSLVSFIGAMLILVLYSVSQGYTRDLEKEWLANILDPFGFQPMGTLSKYATIAEQNAAATPLRGQFLVNRLIWMGLALLTLLLMYTRFSFETKEIRWFKRKKAAETVPATVAVSTNVGAIRRFTAQSAGQLSLRAWLTMLRFETKAIIRNQTFIILVILGLMNLTASLTSFTDTYGNSYYPVTYDVIDSIRGAFNIFILGIIIFYSGVLVWKERDANIHEIKDATPVGIGALFSSKLVAMLIAVFLVLCSAILLGVIAQTAHGYTRYELHVYAQSILVLDMLYFAYFTVLALLFHYLINQRYLAYFAFVAFIIVDEFIWYMLEIDTKMMSFGSVPSAIYSDMNGFGPFIPSLVGFHVYWTLFCLLLCLVMYAFYVRGKDTGLKHRLRTAGQRFGQNRLALALLGGMFVLYAGFVYYNTTILNTFTSSKETENRQKAYEEAYKKYEGIVQPRWIDFTYELDVFPYERSLHSKVTAKAVNKSKQPIKELHFSLPLMPDEVEIQIAGATLKTDDKRLRYRIYTLQKPLQPGDTLEMVVSHQKITKGFEASVSFTSLTQNGTFFNNRDIMPQFGYDEGREIGDKNKRKKLGLPVRQRMPVLNDKDLRNRSNSYISDDADWVQIRTIISTAPDQIAVAPGSLVKEWTKDKRRYFEYQLDHQSLNFYSFISARYEVARERWNDIDLEVYYIKEHAYNVPNMLKSMRKSLEYYTKNFGPYYHKQCRIIEFPRYAGFAQAFPGTMPYSESLGFITDLRKATEDDIDLVYYVVAHEMGHQYWAHQVVGAKMRGTEMLSETFAQYSALMVMEQEYGRDKMHKFLRYEMNSYLRGRGSEFEAERPLIETENQGYIHYRKGSVLMYYLKEMIGEAQVNTALASLIKDYGYQEPPYPTSLAALRAFQEATPDSLQYILKDMFEEITLFSNRVVEASYTQEGEEYVVSFETQSEKFRSDSLGNETPLPLNDYIDIAVFAANPKGKGLGKALVYERIKITDPKQTFRFKVKEKPAQVGIDPYNYLIDRVPDDNLKRVSAS
ncbi:ABC transporter permease/M1 family aminopeptidase [Eisenibacter elegans]|uniref:ABC transporter permease/M1 family aminopeptidase n=1 Tax=Eisenibacter elegans TaxID=997 RepID=UPI00040571CE|nr:M1 family aminopeptidase [Eisenibacter elegans]